MPRSDDAIAGYTAHAHELVERYDALPCDRWLAPILHLLPDGPCRTLDLGAGTGAIARWLAARGHHVVAVEPVAPFRAYGMAHARVEWVDDRLPALERLLTRRQAFRLPSTERRARERRYDPDSGRGVRATSSEFWVVESTDEPREPRAVRRFDLLLLSAVWHHLADDEREAAAPVLRTLAAPGARLILALRHGPGHATRPGHPVDPDATAALLGRHGFVETLRVAVGSIQPGNLAAGVTWTWLAMRAGRHSQ